MLGDCPTVNNVVRLHGSKDLRVGVARLGGVGQLSSTNGRVVTRPPMAHRAQ